MGKDNREDIFTGGIEYSYISLISKKLRVGIIGGGKAGEIKARHFVNNKCYVEVLSKNFDEKIIELSNNSKERLKLIKGEFSHEFLKDKHLIIIAIDDENLKNKIKKFCDENYKIYIDSSNFKDGMGVVPIQKNTESITFALNTKHGNPKGAALLSNKVKDILEEYDDFINFIGIIRNKAKEIPEYKSNIVELTNNEVFKKAFDEGRSEIILREHLPKEIVDYLLKS
ncbi:NAD(P)-dependent oxidoreductase [Clostridium sp.]|uniref:NAD(P)-dependent oxidoreductase n=1 Tax=Clostridium sp. TaxID=1506 RepID=UPI002634C756|nr:NAD(P)-dependent oxidoreductase [Clostridium sp.]